MAQGQLSNLSGFSEGLLHLCDCDDRLVWGHSASDEPIESFSGAACIHASFSQPHSEAFGSSFDCD